MVMQNGFDLWPVVADEDFARTLNTALPVCSRISLQMWDKGSLSSYYFSKLKGKARLRDGKI